MDLETRILELENKVIKLQNVIGEYKELTNVQNNQAMGADPDKLLSKIKNTVVNKSL